MYTRIYLILINIFILNTTLLSKIPGYPLIGFRTAFTNTWLFNKSIKEITDTNLSLSYAPSFGYYYGFIIGYQPSDIFGIEAHILINQHTQVYTIDSLGDKGISVVAYRSKIELGTIDIALLFRYGEYFTIEGGPVFSFIQSAEYTSDYYDYPNKLDVSNKFQKFNLGFCLGFCTEMRVNDQIFINIGIRSFYGIIDIKGVDYSGNPVEKYSTYAFNAELSLGIKYRFRKTGYKY